MKIDLNASIGPREARELMIDFMRWWRDELQSLVPEHRRRWAASFFGRRTIRLEGVTWRISKAGLEILSLDLSEPDHVLRQRIGTVDAASFSRRLDAELPAECGLIRQIRLPAAAERKLRAVVGLSLGRISPFRADSVSYDAKIAGPAESGQIDVEVGIVPNETLERYEMRLAALGLYVRTFRMSGSALRFAPVTGKHTANERLALILGVVAILAWGLALFAVPLSRQAELSSLSADLASLKAPAEHANALGSELSRLKRPSSAAATRLARIDALDALREVSTLLPSDVQLSSFEIADGKVRLAGTGAQPAQIREQLGRAAHFREVTVTQAGGDEGFRAEMTLAGRP